MRQLGLVYIVLGHGHLPVEHKDDQRVADNAEQHHQEVEYGQPVVFAGRRWIEPQPEGIDFGHKQWIDRQHVSGPDDVFAVDGKRDNKAEVS